MMNSRSLRNALVTLVLTSSFVLSAQEARPRPSYKAVRATAAPVIDADLSDAVWQTAPEITGFTQMDPEEGKPAKNDTVVKVAYDDHAIYFGAFMKDDGKPTPLLARRDSDLNNGDYIRISIDSQQDRLSGAAFVVNASNVQMDMTLYNDIYNDNSWDAVWESAAKIVDGGWVAEVRIPYSQLRFPDKPVHTWGLNVSRWNPRTFESTRLVYSPKTESGFVSRFADLNGIEGIRPKRALEMMPYGVVRSDLYSRQSNPFISASEHRMDAGLDLKYALTSSLRLTGTINPDFGQVEVDPAVVNLSQFETFFPEKRPFFTEGASIFNFGNGPANSRWGFNMSFPTFFYSRRIGRSPQGFISEADYQDAPGETTILGAAKVTGKIGKGWTIGVLEALTDREQAMFRTGAEVGKLTVEPMTNYLVARAMKEYGKDSRAGFMFTATNRRLSENLEPSLRQSAYFAGVDGYTLFRDKSWILEWLGGTSMVEGSEEAIALTQQSAARYYHRPDAGHVEFDPARTSLTGYMGRVMLSKQKGRWRPNLQVQGMSPGFEINDVGFASRVDAISTHAVMHYLNTDLAQNEKSRFREISAWGGKWQNFNFDGDLIGNGVNTSFFGQLKNYWFVGAWSGGQQSVLDDQRTRGGPLMKRPGSYFYGGEFGSDSRKKVSFNTWGESVAADDGARSYYGGATFTYRPLPSLRLSISPSITDAQFRAQYVSRLSNAGYEPTFGHKYVFSTLDQKQFDLGIRTEWTMNARLSFQLYLQPFVSSGDYHDFKFLTRPRVDDYTAMGEDEVGFNPDFNFRSVKGSAVVRWEFRPGSAVYVVWNENRSHVAPIGDFRLRRDFSALTDAPSQDVFLVKFTYWLPI
jgi:Domain of unknown function (DUF5916)/Carbohydrate family 9 binding domain-like